MPHLLRGVGGVGRPTPVLLGAAGLAAVGAVLRTADGRTVPLDTITGR